MGERRAIVMLLLASVLVTVADKAFRGKTASEVLPPRVLVGLGIAFLLIAFMAEFAPKLATGFAALFFIGTLLGQGPFVFDKITKQLGR